MERSQNTHSALDELRQIQFDARQSNSLDDLRRLFDRNQSIRRTYADDFDLQLFTTEVQEQILARARYLREEPAPFPLSGTPLSQAGSVLSNGTPAIPSSTQQALAIIPRTEQKEPSDAAEIPPEVERLDAKTWQRATYLALFFALILFAAFFYLVQTARRLNQTPAQVAGQQSTASTKNASNTPSAVSTKPTLRLYTDLVPGTVTIDNNPAQDLKDGELIIDNLEPGPHSIKVTGRSGDAAFSYDVGEKSAPRVIGSPTASNVMAVLVSANDGKAQLISNAQHSEVLLDGKPAGEIGTDGLKLDGLGTTDHLLQVTQDKDRQRFVLTYTTAPNLTVYVKSDPNAGTVVVMAGQDDADVYVNNTLLRRKTVQGQLRIPGLKVGSYSVRIHKAGFADPPPQTVEVKKAEETALQFHLSAVAAELASLEIKGALPGTTVYVDSSEVASVGADGNVTVSTLKAGDHTIELRRDQCLTKKFVRTFRPQETIVLTGLEVTLDKVAVDANTKAQPAPVPPPTSAQTTAPTQNLGMEVAGEQVRKGGGFVHYHTPKVAGRYTFAAQVRKGGVFKHGKLQWYAGFQDSQNYVVYSVDGKHASVREIVDGKSQEVKKVPFEADANGWVTVELSVKPNGITTRVKSPESGWSDLGSVPSPSRDFTQDKVGFLIPGSDEIAIANFRFSAR